MKHRKVGQRIHAQYLIHRIALQGQLDLLRTGGQHQAAVSGHACVGADGLGCGVDAVHPGVGMQGDVLRLSHLGRRRGHQLRGAALVAQRVGQ